MNEAPTLRASDVFPGALPQGGSTTGRRLSARVADSERGHIIAALEENGWRIAATADCLGITRKTLWQKMRRLGISRPGG
jgi:transcriptional regulator of acetoin/glycerol metabolism